MQAETRDHSQSAGERLIGSLLEDSHTVPPERVAALFIDRVRSIGASDVAIYLQDYDQLLLLPLASEGLSDRPPEPIDASLAGRAFTTGNAVEVAGDDGHRIWLPLLDGTDRLGVLGLTLPDVTDRERQLCTRLASLLSEFIVTKGSYSDLFFRTRRRRPMSLAGEMIWQLLPPLTITTPRVTIAGGIEPAYDVGGDVFDYALNGGTAHLAIIDAMGHGLSAAVMAGVALGSYRHRRREGVDLVDKYAFMDSAIMEQFGEESFATALMARLELDTGRLSWINAGHPAPILVRGRRVIDRLRAEPTLPVGFGGATPAVATEALEPGDRVLFFTDGVVEERLATGELFGEDRLTEVLLREISEGRSLTETVRRLSHRLLEARGGRSSDDATVLMVEWHGSG